MPSSSLIPRWLREPSSPPSFSSSASSDVIATQPSPTAPAPSTSTFSSTAISSFLSPALKFLIPASRNAPSSSYPSPKSLQISAIRAPASPPHNSSPISRPLALLLTPPSPPSNLRSGPPHNSNPPVTAPNPPIQVTGLVLCPYVEVFY